MYVRRPQSGAGRWGHAGSVFLLAAITLLTGCFDPTITELRRRVGELETTVDEKNTQIEELKAMVDEYRRRVDQLRAVPPDMLKHLFHPETLEIDTLSGGTNFDSEPGDDGVTVYLKPLDRDGDVVKAAGDIRVELYDLAQPSGQKLIGEYHIPAAQVGEVWYGKLATYHYTVKCPWQHGPPKNPELTIRATFVDYLTQHVMTAQATCTVKLPP